MPTTPPVPAVLPPAPQTNDTTNFDAEADAFVAAQATLRTDMMALASNAYGNAGEAAAAAVSAVIAADDAAASQVAAENSAAIAASSAGAALWVSGTTYADGDIRRSPITRLSYRRLGAGAGATDPSADSTNWTPVFGLGDIWGQVMRLAPNLLQYSEQFDNAAWSKSQATVTANAGTAPDGTSTADKLIGAATVAQHYLHQSVAKPASAVPCTFSISAKAAELGRVVVEIDDGAGNGVYAYVNLLTGAASSSITPFGSGVSGLGLAITSEGSGWHRIALTALMNASATARGFAILSETASNNNTFLGDGVSGLLLAKAQLCVGDRHAVYVSSTSTPSAGQLVARTSYDVDSTGGAFAGVMPPNPLQGDWIRLVDRGRKLGIRPLTLNRNGKTFYGAAEDYVMDVSGEALVLGYDTTYGWTRA